MTLLEYKDFFGLTYEQMGTKFKVCPATVHHWISGRTRPTPKNRKKVVKISKGKIDFT